MLQQTTVNAVIDYYERWIKRFPTVFHVARASLHTILKQWQGLGYYSRAKNIHASAKIICEKFSGQIPRDVDVLKTLPGFGPYTIGALLSIAYNKREAIIDANVRRVVMRLRALEGHADTRHDKQILEFLESVLPYQNLREFNEGLMELGALICRQREPVCVMCPVHKMCKAYQKGIQELIPTPRKKILKSIEAVIGIIFHDGKYLIQRRPSSGLLANLWEFPGGKVNPNESIGDALHREIQEELKVNIKSCHPLMTVTHFYTQYRIKLHAWTCQLQTLPSHKATRRWVSRASLTKYPMPSGSAKIAHRLNQHPN